MLRAGGAVDSVFSLHTLVNQQLDPSRNRLTEPKQNRKENIGSFGLGTERFCSDCSLETSQAVTRHWDFCNPPICTDSASAQAEQDSLPLPAAASFLKVLNSPDLPALVSACLFLSHPHVTSASRGVSNTYPTLSNPTSVTVIVLPIGQLSGTVRIVKVSAGLLAYAKRRWPVSRGSSEMVEGLKASESCWPTPLKHHSSSWFVICIAHTWAS